MIGSLKCISSWDNSITDGVHILPPRTGSDRSSKPIPINPPPQMPCIIKPRRTMKWGPTTGQKIISSPSWTNIQTVRLPMPGARCWKKSEGLPLKRSLHRNRIQFRCPMPLRRLFQAVHPEFLTNHRFLHRPLRQSGHLVFPKRSASHLLILRTRSETPSQPAGLAPGANQAFRRLATALDTNRSHSVPRNSSPW